MPDFSCPYAKINKNIPLGDYLCFSPLRIRKKGEIETKQSFECDSENYKECMWHSQKSDLRKFSLLERIYVKNMWREFEKREHKRSNLHIA